MFIKIVILLVLMSISTTLLYADAATGKKIYIKNLKSYCGMSASEFATTHSQDEWEEIYDAGGFVNEVKKICPLLKSAYNLQWTQDLYEFSYMYANDSDEIINYHYYVSL